MRGGRNGGLVGSAALVLVVALLVVRPWETGDRGTAGPPTARGRVVRAIDGDTI